MPPADPEPSSVVIETSMVDTARASSEAPPLSARRPLSSATVASALSDSRRENPDLYKRKIGGTGGSSQTLPKRQRKKPPANSKVNAYEGACKRLGKEEVLRLRAQWEEMDTKFGGKEFEQGEGMVISLLKQGLSHVMIRAVLGVGGYRVSRLQKVLDKGIETLHTRRERAKPKHAFTDAEMKTFLDYCEQTWELEDGFPCSHRRPRRYFVEQKITWKKLWSRYKERRAAADERIMSYQRWTQYVKFYYPGVRLTRTPEDDCDACVRLDVLLAQPDLPDDERERLELEKHMHLDAAINQRRAVSSFVKEFVSKHCPGQVVESVIPDHVDDPPPASTEGWQTSSCIITDLILITVNSRDDIGVGGTSRGSGPDRRLRRQFCDASLWKLKAFS